MEKEDSYKNLERVNYWLSNGDNKISFALAFTGVLIGFFFSSDKTTELMQQYIKATFKCNIFMLKTLLSILVLLIALGFFGFALRGILYLLKGLEANIDSDTFKQRGLKTKSKIFWKTIVSGTYTQFKQDIDSISENNLLNDIDSQTYINSKICKAKFENYNKGVYSIKIAVVFYIIFKIMTYIPILEFTLKFK